VDRYKWDQWRKLGKMNKEEAMKVYVETLGKKAAGWNTKPKL
jgi:acyl-CoA-binding protein